MDAAPRVLIVDDDADAVRVLLGALHRHGYPATCTAGSVTEALRLVDPPPDGFGPDAILLDLSLSIIDDHALLRRLHRSAPERRSPCVLMLTGNHPASAIKAAVQQGAAGFIPRPYHGVEIAYKIDQAVRQQTARAAELADLLRSDGDGAPGS